jgi:hypothetical protein
MTYPAESDLLAHVPTQGARAHSGRAAWSLHGGKPARFSVRRFRLKPKAVGRYNLVELICNRIESLGGIDLNLPARDGIRERVDLGACSS